MKLSSSGREVCRGGRPFRWPTRNESLEMRISDWNVQGRSKRMDKRREEYHELVTQRRGCCPSQVPDLARAGDVVPASRNTVDRHLGVVFRCWGEGAREVVMGPLDVSLVELRNVAPKRRQMRSSASASISTILIGAQISGAGAGKGTLPGDVRPAPARSRQLAG